jgi:hypothetical protein
MAGRDESRRPISQETADQLTFDPVVNDMVFG